MRADLPDLRTIIDQTALEAIDLEADLQPRLIAQRALAYVKRLRAEQPQLTQEEADKVLQAVMSGILSRLEEIDNAGGRIGSA
jgi:hypothetical protein